MDSKRQRPRVFDRRGEHREEAARRGFWTNLKEDARVFVNQEFGESSSLKGSVANHVRLLFVQGFVAVLVYRTGVSLYSLRSPFLYPLKIPYFFLGKLIEVTTGIMLPVSVKAGKGLYFGHFGYIIINGHCEIGDYCQIGPGVVLGTKGMGQRGAPKLGNRVFVGSGAKILGSVKIGNNVGIGANSVVLSDVPDDVIVAGAPARIVKRHLPSEEFRHCCNTKDTG
jgi:serine O-acetyltransferase